MSKTAEKSDPELWEQVKDEVTAGDKGGDPGQWSARKAQMAVQEYKKRGGGYANDGPDKGDTSLRQWTEDENAPGKDSSDGKSGGGGSGDDAPTKGELYDEAKSRDISGRSKMDKGELKSAIDDDKAG